MAKELDIPLYDEIIKSSEFSDLDYEERLGNNIVRTNNLGEIEEDIPLYDEVVKSPEFSELNYENDIIQEKNPRRIDLGSEPEHTQEKVLPNI